MGQANESALGLNSVDGFLWRQTAWYEFGKEEPLQLSFGCPNLLSHDDLHSAKVPESKGPPYFVVVGDSDAIDSRVCTGFCHILNGCRAVDGRVRVNVKVYRYHEAFSM